MSRYTSTGRVKRDQLRYASIYKPGAQQAIAKASPPRVGLTVNRWWLDEAVDFDKTNSQYRFSEAMRSTLVGNAAHFERMSRIHRTKYMDDCKRRAESPSGQMKKYRRLWEAYLALEVAAKLEGG